MFDSVFSARKRLFDHICHGRMGIEVLEDLLPNGEPLLYERSIWDYKRELSVLPTSRNPTENEKEDHKLKLHDYVKDAVAFYNTYGGYLVIGVVDKPREIVGFDKVFDCDVLNRIIKAETRHSVDCCFRLLDLAVNGVQRRLGLVFVPQRPDSLEPAQFLKDAPPKPDGKRAYKHKTIYFRQGDENVPAETSADLMFLCAQGRRQIVDTNVIGLSTLLDNNLGARDAGFIRFIGREEYLGKLWVWLCDRFHFVKLVSGLGGVGKTTLAREFCEDVIRSSPMGLERVIWLSAKTQFYVAVRGKQQPTTRVDFIDVDSLLRALLLELAYTEEMVSPEWVHEELVEKVIEALQVIPALVVVDDIDTLAPDQQQEVFHTMLKIVGQTTRNCKAPSRALLTARLDLGAPPSQLIRVRGLGLEDFCKYVEMTAADLEVPWTLSPKSKLMARFHKGTDGSPSFASSILRFVELGDSLENALTRWQGSDGEQARKVSFQRELDRLNESQIRTMYAACILGDTSFVELGNITGSNEMLLTDDLGELRKYHLVSLGSEIPGGGARIVAPEAIRLMRDLIKPRVSPSPKRIEEECAKARAGTARLGVDVGKIVHRVVALWADGNPGEALEVAQWADKQNRDNGQLKCLLGRAYLRLDEPDAKRADVEFAHAHRLKCDRTELMPLWMEAKTIRQDWVGLIHISKIADTFAPAADNVFYRAQAYNALAQDALRAGSLRVAAEHMLAGGKDIDAAFKGGYASGRVMELREQRNLMLWSYVMTIDRLTASKEEFIDVWLATVDAFDCYVRKSGIMRLGVDRLTMWWSAVEARGKYDVSSQKLMKVQLDKLAGILTVVQTKGSPDADLVGYLEQRASELYGRWQAYRESTND
jgi:hypothetical protein